MPDHSKEKFQTRGHDGRGYGDGIAAAAGALKKRALASFLAFGLFSCMTTGGFGCTLRSRQAIDTAGASQTQFVEATNTQKEVLYAYGSAGLYRQALQRRKIQAVSALDESISEDGDLTNSGDQSEKADAESSAIFQFSAKESVRVRFTARDIKISMGTAPFSLLDGVSARDETGASVYVWVLNDGGFSVEIPGRYFVTYAAMQKDKIVTVKRSISVLGNAGGNTAVTEKQRTVRIESETEQITKYALSVYDTLVPLVNSLEEEYGRLALSENASASETQDAAAEDVSNWADIFATFIAKYNAESFTPFSDEQMNTLPLDELSRIFWDMNETETVRTENGKVLRLHAKTYLEIADEYNFSQAQRELQSELMEPEFQRVYAMLTGEDGAVIKTRRQAEAVLSELPADLSAQRREVVETACLAVGLVPYQWGGKYSQLGMAPEWGVKNGVRLTDEGFRRSVTQIPGLDCSGYVSWVFINAAGQEAALQMVGNGSSNQWVRSEPVAWEDGEIGDLVFFWPPGEKSYNHVGIIVAIDGDGSYLVANCSSDENGVAITDAWRTGFRYVRRPVIYDLTQPDDVGASGDAGGL